MTEDTIRMLLHKQNIQRIKILFVPFIIISGKHYFMMLKDREYNEWTFLSGGCKFSDTYPDVCLYREVEEETKGIITAKMLVGKLKPFKYFTEMKVKKFRLRVLYYIYPVQIRGDRTTMIHLEHKFRDTIAKNKSQNENTELRFFSLYDMGKIRIWDFIQKIINSKIFLQEIDNPSIEMIDIKL